MYKKGGNAALIFLVVAFALLSVAFLLWSQRQRDGAESNFSIATAPTPSTLPTPPTPSPSPSPDSSPSPEPETANQAPVSSAPPAVSPTPEIAGTSESSPAENSTAVATVSSATPTPAPTPALEINIQTVAADPRLWPREIVLKEPVSFPVYIDGKPAGNIQVGKGGGAKLRAVHPDGTVELERLGSYARAKANQTDLLERARVIGLRLLGASATIPSATPQSSASSAESASPAKAETSGSVGISMSVTRDRKTEPGPDGTPQHAWYFHIKLGNTSATPSPALHGVFVAFYRDPLGSLRIASNQTVSGTVPAGGSSVIDPDPVRVNQIDGFAVLLRDPDGKITASFSTRDSIARDWAALEKMNAGELLPQ